jgi:hypothetical protein
MKFLQTHSKKILLIFIGGILISIVTLILSNKQNPCDNPNNTKAHITSLSSYAEKNTNFLDVFGCHFSGFEGDKNIWIENQQGEKGILYGDLKSSDSLIHIQLQEKICQTDNSYTGFDCQKFLSLNPGKYKIYVSPWDKTSNKVIFQIL